MSSISDDPAPTVATPNPNHRSTPPNTKRLFLTLTILLSFLLSLPFLLSSTAIHRSPLPSSPSLPPLSPLIRLHALILLQTPPDSLTSALKSRTTSNSTLDVTTDSSILAHHPSLFKDPDDDAVDQILDSALREYGGGDSRYTVVVAEGKGKARVVVGKYRHAWIVGRVAERDLAELIVGVFEVLVGGGLGSGSEDRRDFMPVGIDGNLVLSFSLLNAEPSDWVYDWDFQNIEKIISHSVVNALAPLANITVESQVLYHTPTSSNYYWDEKLASYVFGTKDLPFFVNSNEWHLDTSVTAAGQSKVLQFVVYIPAATECPLLLQLPDGEISRTNGFISPMWGGVVVWNPPECSSSSQRTNPSRRFISTEDLDKILQVFIAQLRMLFGLNSNYQDTMENAVTKFLSSEKGFSEWELDALYRQHAYLNLLSCVTTLESLSKLVQSLPRMIIMDEIGKEVKLSLEAASLAQVNASLGIYNASAVSSRQARALAEDAFFHPSIMSISYSSMEHYFAIYMPFFAPVCLHVLLSTVKELKRYKKERAKYMSYIAEQTKQKKSN